MTTTKKKKSKQYPIRDGHRRHYMRYPVLVTEQIRKKMVGKVLVLPDVGQYVAVNVHSKGYSFVPTGSPCDIEAFCQKGCDIHNKYHGWTKKEVMEMVGKSMGLIKKKKISKLKK